MGKRKKTKNQSIRLAQTMVLKHFDGPGLADLTTFRRSFPATARADLQRVLDQLLHGAQLLGLFRRFDHGTLKLADLMDTNHSAVMVAPIQYDEVDIGEPQPMRCLHQGLWLLHRNRVPLSLLLAQPEHERPGVEIELAALPQEESLNEARLLLDEIEFALKEASIFRGKVLSLESGDHYSGIAGKVAVHRLPPVRRDEVILPEKTLRLLERNVHDFIAQRAQLQQLGMPLKKGLLFYGPPGTGKTHTIRYLASQLSNHTTFLITAEQVGRLAQYVQFARFLQPALLVIEDVDLIGRDRSRMGGCEEILLNVLLNEMDGLREDAEIIFLLTTNRPEELEFALSSRPGRIDQAIEFPMPDDEGRRKLVKLYARGLPLTAAVVEATVRRSAGASAAFIKELMRRSAQYFLRDGSKTLQTEHVEQAVGEMVIDGGSLNLKLLGASQGFETTA